MRLSLTLLLAAAATIVAQDTVSVTASGTCEPHGDHWHCANGVPEPTTPPSPEQIASHSAEEAAEKSTRASNAVSNVVSSGAALVTPSASSHSHDDDDHDDGHVATASTCEPHGDHWHCPSGVAEPTTPPAESASRSAAAATTASGSQTPQQTANTAAQVGAGQLVALIGAAVYFL